MKMGMSRLLIALAAVAAGGAIFAAARRYTPAQENAGRETVELNLLMSLGGDGMREEYMRQRLDAYGELNPDVRVSATFVESDTLVFLKLLYAGKGYHYDVVCMGGRLHALRGRAKIDLPHGRVCDEGSGPGLAGRRAGGLSGEHDERGEDLRAAVY